MMRNTLQLFAMAGALAALPLRAADTAQAEKIFDSLLAAQAAKNYDAFVAGADDHLKAALTKTQFDASSDLMNKKCKAGYEATFLGELKKHGFQVFLYRLRFKDGSDDILGTMSLKDDKVGGIYFK